MPRRRLGQNTGFVTLEPQPDTPALLVTRDLGNAQDGFAWTDGLESDPVPPTSIYETTNSGRSWHAFTPRRVTS